MIVETPEYGEVIILNGIATDRLQAFFDELERTINDIEQRLEALEEA